MHIFLARHREILVPRWLEKLRARLPLERALTDVELVDSFHLYLDEVIESLRANAENRGEQEGKSAVARVHGSQRHALQRSIEDLVREYGMFFECVVETAVEVHEPLQAAEYIALSNCLSTGCAQAVSEYALRRDAELQRAQYEHFAFIAHELRNPLHSVSMAWDLLRDGRASLARHGQLLERNLQRIHTLIDQALVEVRVRSVGLGMSLHLERARLYDVLEETRGDCEADASVKQISLDLACDPALNVSVDLRLFRSALSNLVRNAVKFSHAGARVELRGRAEQGRALVEIEDECGGLPPGRTERLFEAFSQAGTNRSGFGLGLAIAREAIEAQHGSISVRSIDGKGCVFTVDVAQDE